MTDNLQGYYAGFISRLIAFSIDIAIIVVVLIFAGWLLNAMSTIFQLGILESISTFFQIWVTSLIVLLFSAGYYIFFWTLIGKTPGKILLGLRVVSRSGRPVTFWQALRRYVGYFLSAIALYIGYIWILLDNRRQGWHDKLADTFVVYDWDARPGSFLAKRMEAQQQEEDSSSNE
jgi:uncharacterized RDD family membrane protein YckC